MLRFIVLIYHPLEAGVYRTPMCRDLGGCPFQDHTVRNVSLEAE
jgi:hypothetical protein